MTTDDTMAADDTVAPGGRRPLRIGLTGPIGCGKSTVARWLEEGGGYRIDADELAREVSAPGTPSVEAIRARFGSGVVSDGGVVDRRALAALVFSDPIALHDLEAIVHPEVRRRVVAELAAAEAAGVSFVVVEAIKLVESGLAGTCDEVWLVECEPGTQVRRLIERGMAETDALRRIEAQGADLATRLAPAATRRLRTDGDLDVTRGRVEDLLAAALARYETG